ncbi:DUF4918 family protein [Sphingobacteriaceae bacterium AH-315-L07]|nr:DUF4918 family protein [Bacteroidia bacterium]MBN4052158.1 DUF4918 family protein [Sphingobacteriaceae bacterium AH-315-L07]
MTFGDKVIDFYNNINQPIDVPADIKILNPFLNPAVSKVLKEFCHNYLSTKDKKVLIIGINPGRFGAGVTGIPFTDPIRLRTDLGIKNNFENKAELSSKFVYELIHKFGGVKCFYNQFYITSVCPLGFTHNNKNINYYDSKELQNSLKNYIVSSIKDHMNFGIDRSIAYSFGKGKNFKYLNDLNSKYGFFEKIIPLPHPRWVMQYRLKSKDKIIEEMVNCLNNP